MCCYGIELLEDNIAECRANMLEVFSDYLALNRDDDLYRAAFHVLSLNLVHGDAMTMRATDGAPIQVVEWGYLGKGKFQRRDFRLDVLTGMASFSAEDSLFSELGKHEIFTPAQTYPPMSVRDLAAANDGSGGKSMIDQASFALRGRNPDVLTCIANLSNDEVFTPPEFANRMLDTLAEAWAEDNDGASIWADSSVRFLDPFTKSGVFLREIAKRLIVGLETEIPDLQTRVDHILTQQVFGIGITRAYQPAGAPKPLLLQARNGESIPSPRDLPMTMAISGSSAPSTIGIVPSVHFVVPPRALFDREPELENHAYAFIHTSDIKARIGELFGAEMQFDVIIGNPPYQMTGRRRWHKRLLNLPSVRATGVQS